MPDRHRPPFKIYTMQQIKIIGSETIKQYGGGFNRYQFKADGTFPPMKNGGFSNFYFITPVNFEPVNIPQVLKRETENYKFYELPFDATDNTGKTISGYYYRSENKHTGKTETETFDFS